MCWRLPGEAVPFGTLQVLGSQPKDFMELISDASVTFVAG